MSADRRLTCVGYADCERRFNEIESRLDENEKEARETWASISESITQLKVSVANLNGRIAGYLVAASLLGVVVAFLAEYVLRGKT